MGISAKREKTVKATQLTPWQAATNKFSSRRITRGQSLLEVIAATLILFIGVTGASNGFLAFTLRNRRTELNTNSTAAVRTVLDNLRLADVDAMPVGGAQQVCNPNLDASYTCVPFNAALIQAGSVVVTYCPNRADNTREYCDPAVPTRRHVGIEVYETDGEGGTQIAFSTETVFAELRDL